MFDISNELSTKKTPMFGGFLLILLLLMIFDLDMIKNVYGTIKQKVDSAKKICNHPLTLSEKILYSHLWSVSYTHIRDHDTIDDIVCRLLL